MFTYFQQSSASWSCQKLFPRLQFTHFTGIAWLNAQFTISHHLTQAKVFCAGKITWRSKSVYLTYRYTLWKNNQIVFRLFVSDHNLGSCPIWVNMVFYTGVSSSLNNRRCFAILIHPIFNFLGAAHIWQVFLYPLLETSDESLTTPQSVVYILYKILWLVFSFFPFW